MIHFQADRIRVDGEKMLSRMIFHLLKLHFIYHNPFWLAKKVSTYYFGFITNGGISNGGEEDSIPSLCINPYQNKHKINHMNLHCQL